MVDSDSRTGQGGSFHVFVSFRGPDVRQTILSHLSSAFEREGIRAYIDNRELEIGAVIKTSLEEAIEDSRIAIVIFSQNYASSRWCLDELSKIMDRKERGELIVKPVFFWVEPREVRKPRDSFKKALDVHEGKCSPDEMNRWRNDLFKAGSLAGWPIDEKVNEAAIVSTIVRDINALLDLMPLHVAKFPVGIERQVERIKGLLNFRSSKVLQLGLWGMGGIGKTTLVKAVFNDIFHQFDGCAFLKKVSVQSANPSIGLAGLQQLLLSEVLRRKDVTVSCTDRGINVIRDRLCKRKVLLVLDDVSETVQLDALAGGPNWFGDGSLIIITARDKALMRNYKDWIVHEIRELPHSEALQLFSQHASLVNKGQYIREDLIDSCLRYAKGLPLALEVLGSLLQHQPEDLWINIIELLAQSPSNDIDKVLRVSFDRLPDKVKEIFLDIACFFMGKAQNYVEKVLDACRFKTSLGIKILIEKSLITTTKERR